MKNHCFVLLFLFSPFTGFSQQRIGFELSSRFEDLSSSVHFQKIVASHFLLGAGAMINGKQYMYENVPTTDLHNPFGFVESRKTENGQELELYSYETYSRRGFSLLLMSGWFHEFNTFQGIRFNLNVRFGVSNVRINTYYRNLATGVNAFERQTHTIPYQAICPEIYHTLRQSNKWTFYYGFRVPYYFSMFPKAYSPQYKMDIYHRAKFELCIGLTRQVGKAGPEKSAIQ